MCGVAWQGGRVKEECVQAPSLLTHLEVLEELTL
jgi:hypothetical protein